LPFPDRFADLVYSWSVFEHLADVAGILSELRRILKPDGLLFLQIEPLFYSAFGSHLQRLVPEPWAHLTYSEEEFIALAQAASDNVCAAEQDTLYRTNAFEDVKNYLIQEYRKLNRIKPEELAAALAVEGFEIVTERRFAVEGVAPSATLLARYSSELLMTNQIVLIARRTR